MGDSEGYYVELGQPVRPRITRPFRQTFTHAERVGLSGAWVDIAAEAHVTGHRLLVHERPGAERADYVELA